MLGVIVRSSFWAVLFLFVMFGVTSTKLGFNNTQMLLCRRQINTVESSFPYYKVVLSTITTTTSQYFRFDALCVVYYHLQRCGKKKNITRYGACTSSSSRLFGGTIRSPKRKVPRNLLQFYVSYKMDGNSPKNVQYCTGPRFYQY